MISSKELFVVFNEKCVLVLCVAFMYQVLVSGSSKAGTGLRMFFTHRGVQEDQESARNS